MHAPARSNSVIKVRSAAMLVLAVVSTIAVQGCIPDAADPLPPCDDHDSCTLDLRDPGDVDTADDAKLLPPCDDHDSCTLDVQAPGDVDIADDAELLPPCDDHDPCTLDLRALDDACEHPRAPDGTPCGDTGACAAGECVSLCHDGTCPPGLQTHDGCHCAPLPTGARSCTDLDTIVDCGDLGSDHPLHGQDGHFGHRDMAYEDLKNGTARDTLSGLVWARDVEGPMSWDAAEEWCTTNSAGLPGSGWRLPTDMEAVGMLRYEAGKCLQDALLGDRCPNFGWTWTGTLAYTDFRGLDVMICIQTTQGVMEDCEKRDAYLVRCVQGPLPEDEPQDRWLVLGDVVWDRVTGLAWDRMPVATRVTWPQALALCREKAKGWRLPTVKELVTLISRDGEEGSRIHPTFEALRGREAYEWTATPNPTSGFLVETIHFHSGHIHENPGNIETDDERFAFSVRCVNDDLPDPREPRP
jgi:hypothetical protein